MHMTIFVTIVAVASFSAVVNAQIDFGNCGPPTIDYTPGPLFTSKIQTSYPSSTPGPLFTSKIQTSYPSSTPGPLFTPKNQTSYPSHGNANITVIATFISFMLNTSCMAPIDTCMLGGAALSGLVNGPSAADFWNSVFGVQVCQQVYSY
jgi:hypothetical protein